MLKEKLAICDNNILKEFKYKNKKHQEIKDQKIAKNKKLE